MNPEKTRFSPNTIDETSRDDVRPHGYLFRRYTLALLVTVLFVFYNSRLSPLYRPDEGFDNVKSYRYSGEHINWYGCGEVDDHKVECSEIEVPMDQFNHTRSGNKTFSIPLIRLRGKNVIGNANILLNFGGPGVSGLESIRRNGQRLNNIIGEGFHLLSFDPRGIKSSRPSANCSPDQETRGIRAMYRNRRALEDAPDIYAHMKNFAKACRDTVGEHGAYINTPQTAADMNSILDAIGQKSMYYWGFSYGTVLGQTYASLFPERSERVIIDGVVNHFNHYLSRQDGESFADSENVLDGFCDECIKVGAGCPLAAHASTKNELRSKILGLIDDLDAQPLSVYVNNTVYGVLDRFQFVSAIIYPSLYNPSTWYSLANQLAKLLDGNATEMFLAHGLRPAWTLELNGVGAIFVDFNDGLAGRRWWPQDLQGMLDLVGPLLNSSLFSPVWTEIVFGKQQWLIEHTHDFVPRRGIQTAHPLLILSTTYDPTTPLISARSALDTFKSSQIVEVLGYGHCSVAMPSRCLVEHVQAYFYEGVVPEEYTYCEVDEPYFVPYKEKQGMC